MFVRMRQWTRNIIHYKEAGSPYSFAGFIGIFSTTFSTGIFIHEISHAVDGIGGFALGKKLSTDKIWLDAYDADSAVPDNHARISQGEVYVASLTKFTTR